MPHQHEHDALPEFHTTGKAGGPHRRKNLEGLRSFFSFCQQAGWILQNPAKALKPPKLPEKSSKVKVFSEEDLEKILKACDEYPQRNAWGHDNRARVKALVMTLRYSGMRIGDVVGLQKSHLKSDKLFLNTQKSGSKIYVPLPKIAVEALNAIENGSAYFFWSGKGLRKSAVADCSGRFGGCWRSPTSPGIRTCSGIRSPRTCWRGESRSRTSPPCSGIGRCELPKRTTRTG